MFTFIAQLFVSIFHWGLIRRKSLPMNDFEFIVPNLYVRLFCKFEKPPKDMYERLFKTTIGIKFRVILFDVGE